jgi:hypothetical protein
MDLFSDGISNLLPYDGTVHYFGPIISSSDSDRLFHSLLNTIEWKQDEAIIYGKHILTKRKVAWYGDRPFAYTYSRTTKFALPWTNELLELKSLTEVHSQEKYNSCLLNLYHTGEEGMAWHSDGEKDLKKNGAIASISLGAERKFSFKHKESKLNVTTVLQNGSLLVMKDETQAHWLHRLPPTTKIRTPRINLTFRTIVDQ